VNHESRNNSQSKLYRSIVNIIRKNIYYAVSDKRWSFYWDAYYITKGLREHLGLNSYMLHSSPWKLKRQIIHFGDRYLFLFGPYHKLHPSNDVFLTWFHGDPNDPNPDMKRLFEKLPDSIPYFRRVVVSCRISERILIEQGVPGKKIVKIPLGVDLAEFTPAASSYRSSLREKFGIAKDKFCIGSFQKDGVGWNDSQEPKMVKGPDIFLEVISKIYDKNRNITVLLTGPARGYVKNGLKRIGVPYVHHYLSDYLDIVDYYRAIDLYVITSRSEGGPKALLESWATGVPVVSTRVGMPADMIEHRRNGMIAEIEDHRELANHALELIEDAELRETCRARGLEDVKNYDWNIIAERYYNELYRPILE